MTDERAKRLAEIREQLERYDNHMDWLTAKSVIREVPWLLAEVERLEREIGSLGASPSADSTPGPPLPGPPNTITESNGVIKHFDVTVGPE